MAGSAEDLKVDIPVVAPEYNNDKLIVRGRRDDRGRIALSAVAAWFMAPSSPALPDGLRMLTEERGVQVQGDPRPRLAVFDAAHELLTQLGCTVSHRERTDDSGISNLVVAQARIDVPAATNSPNHRLVYCGVPTSALAFAAVHAAVLVDRMPQA